MRVIVGIILIIFAVGLAGALLGAIGAILDQGWLVLTGATLSLLTVTAIITGLLAIGIHLVAVTA